MDGFKKDFKKVSFLSFKEISLLFNIDKNDDFELLFFSNSLISFSKVSLEDKVVLEKV